MEDAQHYDPVAVVAILEHVGSAEHLHHDLPVLFARGDGATEFRMPGEQLRSGDDFVRDDCRKLWGLVLEERYESTSCAAPPEPPQPLPSVLPPASRAAIRVK